MSHILVVDDDFRLAKILARALVKAGHSVLTACSLQAAKVYQEESFDILLLDVRLPNGDGRSLADFWPNARAVTMSGYPDNAPDLTKPFAVPELLAKMDEQSSR